MIHVIIIARTVYSVGSMVFWRGTGNMSVGGLTAFRYFTVDSNVLTAIASAALLPSLVRGLKAGTVRISRGTAMLMHAGATSVAITFFTVLFFLGLAMGYAPMFAGMNFFMHKSTPVLTMIAHVLFEDELSPRLTFKQSISGWIPVFIYGIFYVSLAVFTHVWPNFYGFNAGGMWYIAYPVMMLAGFGLSHGLWALQNKMCKAFTK